MKEGDHRTSFLLRWLINALAIWAAIRLVPGIVPVDEGFVSIAAIALIFGLVNAIIRPILIMLTCPLIILTLGLGTLLINTAMFWLAGQIGVRFGVGFTIEGGFWPAFWGALIVSILSAVLTAALGGRKERRKEE